MFERVKNYPIWTLQLDSHPTLIIIDPMNAMAIWGTLEHMKTHPPDPYQVVISGVEIYPFDSALDRFYNGNCEPTLLDLHNYSFLIERQMMTFTVIGLPKNMSLTVLSNFVQGVVLMVNTTEEDWEQQLQIVWGQCKEIQGLQALVTYSDDRVIRAAIMEEIRTKATVMKIGLVTLEVIQYFYGALGRLCKRNMETMQGAAMLKKIEKITEEKVAKVTGEVEDKKKKRCQVM